MRDIDGEEDARAAQEPPSLKNLFQPTEANIAAAEAEKRYFYMLALWCWARLVKSKALAFAGRSVGKLAAFLIIAFSATSIQFVVHFIESFGVSRSATLPLTLIEHLVLFADVLWFSITVIEEASAHIRSLHLPASPKTAVITVFLLTLACGATFVTAMPSPNDKPPVHSAPDAHQVQATTRRSTHHHGRAFNRGAKKMNPQCPHPHSPNRRKRSMENFRVENATHRLYRVIGGGTTSNWTSIGAAWPNKDGVGVNL